MQGWLDKLVIEVSTDVITKSEGAVTSGVLIDRTDNPGNGVLDIIIVLLYPQEI